MFKRINLCTISTCQNEIDFHVVLFYSQNLRRGRLLLAVPGVPLGSVQLPPNRATLRADGGVRVTVIGCGGTFNPPRSGRLSEAAHSEASTPSVIQTF